MFDRDAFYSELRKARTKLFGTRLSQANVDGVNAILDSCLRNGVKDVNHVANILAQVYHETGGYMSPIKETVYASHKNKNPSDSTVKKRLENAFATGKMPGVKSPYWRAGYFGRGQIQITHKSNYDRLGKRIGVDLANNPSLALELPTSADIAVIGMSEGIFTGKKLSDFVFPSCLYETPSHHPRRIVNGNDGTDATIREHHIEFASALLDAGWNDKSYVAPANGPEIELPPLPESKQTKKPVIGAIMALVAAISSLAYMAKDAIMNWIGI